MKVIQQIWGIWEISSKETNSISSTINKNSIKYRMKIDDLKVTSSGYNSIKVDIWGSRV